MVIHNNVQLNLVDLNSDEEQFQAAVQPQKLPTTITSLIMGLAYNSRNSLQHVYINRLLHITIPNLTYLQMLLVLQPSLGLSAFL